MRNRKPQLVASMLNPALISAIIAESSKAYSIEVDRPMPWTLSFIACPLILHRGTRLALPRSTATYLATWASKNPILIAGFPRRAHGLVDPVKEGIRFGADLGVLSIENGGIRSSLRKPRGFKPAAELDEILRKSSFLGRWLSRERPATIFAMFGVEP
jgi:hypothetical protein